MDDGKRQAIADALRAGRSCRDVAEEFGCHPGTMSKIAREQGITLDGSRTAHANEARQEHIRARWAAESRKVLDDAQRIRRQLFSRWTLHNWYQGEHYEHEVDQPTAGDIKALAIAYGILADKALALHEHGELVERIAELEAHAERVEGEGRP